MNLPVVYRNNNDDGKEPSVCLSAHKRKRRTKHELRYFILLQPGFVGL